ncbi:hypothetical protein [Streptomyces paludis]|uniref:Uncharacterized protein n=1 Tax=Streptomyces paludis TaxID=2282738 RepID=A0A345HN21_9ACTN|nr:hypothetical protein [Streptomyces paludis]AXG78095.1 hypothetical protein DVK44_10685 [Streptomyces paludis]
MTTDQPPRAQGPARGTGAASRAVRAQSRSRARRVTVVRAAALLVTLVPLVSLASLALALAAPPASAHPFGPPSTAGISAQGSRISLSWQAEADDWVALGHSLRAFDSPDDDPAFTELTGEQKLQRSKAVHTYLLRHIEVRQAGRACRATVAPLEGLLDQGARFTFDCPEPLVEADVTLSPLTDLNESYRTMLTAEGAATPKQSLFTSAAPTHRLRFTASGDGVRNTVTAVATGTAIAALAALAVPVTRRVRRARQQTTNTPSGSAT